MINRKGAIWAILSLIWVIGLPRLAGADPVRVTGGFVLIEGMLSGGGPVQLVGERGFSLDSRVSISGGVFEPGNTCSVPECVPGTEVSLRALWSGSDLAGQLTFDGQTYSDFGGLNSLAGGVLELGGSFVAPAFAPTATVMAPFQLLRQSSFTVPNASGIESILHTLNGHGIATIQLSLGFGDDPAWVIDSVRYDFSASDPVPEPGTMLLVGLGIAGAARRFTRARAKV